MLQQTRVAAVIPYYERFLTRFPNAEALAAASEQDLLAAWAGLGYYSRARNLQAAARQIVQRGAFPGTYEAIRELPGIGDYTAAAIASIAFGKPHPAVDGNVARVLARITAEPGDIGAASTRERLRAVGAKLLAPARPGEFNQAMMELGATLCLPRQPQCLLCPVAEHCAARAAGRQQEFPIKRRRTPAHAVSKRLLIIRSADAILLWKRPPATRRLAGFWELPEPEQVPGARIGTRAGEFRHNIVNTLYRFEVFAASIESTPAGFRFLGEKELAETPLSTAARKALACWKKRSG